MRNTGRIMYLVVLMLLVLVSVANAEVPIVSLREEITEEIKYSLEEEEKFIQLIKTRLEKLENLGVDPELFADLEIRVYPDYQIPCGKGEQLTLASGKASSTYKYSILHSTITLATRTGEDTLYHELGHILSDKKLNSKGYNWSEVNDIGLNYIEEKRYVEYLDENEYSKDLTSKAQVELPWKDRLAEWFAEDVRQAITEKMAEEKGIILPPVGSSFGLYEGVGPEKTKEVDNLLEKLIFDNPA